MDAISVLSVATQKSRQYVNKTIVIRFKGRVRPAFFRFEPTDKKALGAHVQSGIFKFRV
jgi:hypothetical protein